jgi:diadenosine tetraphosphatase ApaH/serine/threonine PP2A family protein phosphatase
VAGTRFINDGSAGKPKDGDPRACWALVETSPAGVTVGFHRIDYDIEAAAQGILASQLPHEFEGQLREARGFKA